MRLHRSLLLTTIATGALFVPVERAALTLLPGSAGGLYAQAFAGKGGGGDHDRGDHDKSDRGGKSDHDRDDAKGAKDRDDHDAKGRKDRDEKGDHDAKGDHDGKGRKDDDDKGRKDRGAKGRTGLPAFHASNFVRKIDNPYLSFKPGTVYTIRGEDLVGKITVTSRTRTILGVRTRVVRDVERVEGKLAEKTTDYYAQDKLGNVWYFGEKSVEYRNGKPFSTGGSWLSGVHGAKPGIVMEAKPKVGDTYQQERAKGVAQDMARVLSLKAPAKASFGTFRKSLKTYEFSPIEPDLQEHKFYVRGVGQVLTIDLLTGEREELVGIGHAK